MEVIIKWSLGSNSTKEVKLNLLVIIVMAMLHLGKILMMFSKKMRINCNTVMILISMPEEKDWMETTKMIIL